MDNDPLFLVEWQGGIQVAWLASTRSYTTIAFGSPEFLSLHYFQSASGGGGAGITYIVQRILAWNLDGTWETDIRSLGVTARVRKEMLSSYHLQSG